MLVLFLDGANSTPSEYTEIADHLAGLGDGVVDPRYADGQLIGLACNADDNCFTQLRGETAFGDRQAYGPGLPSFHSTILPVDAPNSIVGRLVALLDDLSNRSGALDQD